MKTNRQEFSLRVSVTAVRSALLALALMQVARAEEGDAAVKELTSPTKTIEAGVGYVSKDSFKFGEYNGLERKGAYGIGNLDFRGGGAYDSADPSRWRLSAHNLGLETRDAKAEYGWQGRFRLNLGYDELLRNENNRYQTPYLGAGGTNLALPANWATPAYPTAATMAGGNAFPGPSATFLGLAATGYGSPLVTNTSYVCRSTTHGCAINPALSGVLGTIYTVGLPVTAANIAMLAHNLSDLNDFHFVDLSTKRKKYDAGASFDINRAMNVAFSYRQEKKNGLREMGVVNADAGPSGSLAGENSVIFPKLIDTTTDQYNASFDYTGKNAFFTFAYYGSIFTNNVKSMTIADPWGSSYTYGATVLPAAFGVSSATISEEPNNSLHQFRLTGGYNLTRSTKAVADVSYSSNTQNDTFVLDPAMFATPTGAASPALNNASFSGESSANARVLNKTFDFKLTSRPVDRLSLLADYKYDNRDNHTPVSSFVWYDAGAKNFGAPNSVLNGATISGITLPAGLGTTNASPLYSGVNIVDNRPYSKSLSQVDLESEMALAAGHAIRIGYQHQNIDRYCNNTWIDCSFADQTRENTLKVEYRFTAIETVSGRVALDQSSRSVDYNPNAWMAMQPSLQYLTNIPSLAAHGWNGSVLGFLNLYGLTPNGLPLAANQTPTLTPNGASPLTAAQALAVYNLLFGSGNGSLSNNYYANHNVTNNWAGLDVFNMADRDRSHLRASLNWQATDALAFQTGFDYRRDNYSSNIFGLEDARAWSLNFDGAFTPTEDLTFDAYYTHEDSGTRTANGPASNGTVSRNAATGSPYTTATGAAGTNTTVAGLCPSDSTAGLTHPTQFQIFNNNAKIDPCAQWTANMRETADTVGMSFTKSRFLSPRLTLSGDGSYSRSVTSNDMGGGFYFNNGLQALIAEPATFFIHAAALPDITTSIAHLGLTGRYQLSRSSVVRVAYSFNWLHTDDYTYVTTQPAQTSGSVMPTMDTPQNYVVHVIGVSYAYSFQ